MDPRWRLLIFPFTGSLAAVRALFARGRVAHWQHVGWERGLRLESRAGVPLELFGDIEGWRVVVSEWHGEDYLVKTEFRAFKPRSDIHLSLSRERLFFRGDDIETGDEEFDREISVQGDEATALAVLDRATRALVLEVMARRDITLRDGDISCEFRGYVKDRSRLKSTLDDVLLLARCVSVAPEDIPRRLAVNASGYEELAVRLRTLDLLHRNFRETEPAREAFVKAVQSRRPEMRLAGAMYLGDFDRVATIAGGESLGPALRLRAVRHLVNAGGAERAGPLLQGLLSTRSPAVLKAVVEGIGRLRYRPAAPQVIALLARAHRETTVTAAAALGKIGDASAEPTLLSLLDREEPSVQVAAAQALGHVGTARAVEPLLARTRGFLDSELKRAAREAVGAIQSRLGNADSGRLSLSEVSEREGGLSVTTEGAGRLSLNQQEQSE